MFYDDLVNHAAPFASDSRALHLSDDEMHARAQGFASMADMNAEVKRRFATERLEQEAQEETDRLLGNVHDLKAHFCLFNALKEKRERVAGGIARLQKHGDSARSTQAAIVAASKAAVRNLLVKVGLAEPESGATETVVDQAALEAALLAEQRAAREAAEAIEIANAQLATIDRQIEAVESRRDRYLTPELEHLATRLSSDYVRAIAEVRKVHSRLLALGYALPGALGYYGNGWPDAPAISFPKPPTLKHVPDEKLTVKVSGDDITFWRGVAETLTKNPDADITVKP
jgi:hypothetical protein